MMFAWAGIWYSIGCVLLLEMKATFSCHLFHIVTSPKLFQILESFCTSQNDDLHWVYQTARSISLNNSREKHRTSDGRRKHPVPYHFPLSHNNDKSDIRNQQQKSTINSNTIITTNNNDGDDKSTKVPVTSRLLSFPPSLSPDCSLFHTGDEVGVGRHSLTRADEGWRRLTRADGGWQGLTGLTTFDGVGQRLTGADEGWRRLTRADGVWRRLARADEGASWGQRRLSVITALSLSEGWRNPLGNKQITKWKVERRFED